MEVMRARRRGGSGIRSPEKASVSESEESLKRFMWNSCMAGCGLGQVLWLDVEIESLADEKRGGKYGG